VHDPDGASWEVYTVLADAPSDTSLGGSSRRHRLHQPRRAPDVELTTHGVPDAGPAATREQTPAAASVCCDTGTAQSCCDASAKSSCCEDTTSGLPTSCGCS